MNFLHYLTGVVHSGLACMAMMDNLFSFDGNRSDMDIILM